MKKYSKYILLSVFVFVLFLLGGLIADKYILQDKIIRFHVVANSDCEEDQNNKLAVRDAVLEYLNNLLDGCISTEQAKMYLFEKTNEIESLVNETLIDLNANYSGKVLLKEEGFNLREYDTFTLPSGIYTALKIELGKADGKNWWCVAFPTLCLASTVDGFQKSAVEAGIDEDLADTLSKNDEYNIRFFLLDCIGKLEKMLHLF